MDDEVEKWLHNIDDVKKSGMDLSRDEDLSIAIMNLISLEEHLYFTAMKTENARYLEMLNSVRELRKNCMKKIVLNPKGEEWCISKHLLAASMRLMETGTKELSKQRKNEAIVFFKAAFDLHSLFFAINTGAIKDAGLKVKDINTSTTGLMGSISAIMKKIVDCCKE